MTFTNARVTTIGVALALASKKNDDFATFMMQFAMMSAQEPPEQLPRDLEMMGMLIQGHADALMEMSITETMATLYAPQALAREAQQRVDISEAQMEAKRSPRDAPVGFARKATVQTWLGTPLTAEGFPMKPAVTVASLEEGRRSKWVTAR